MRVTWLSPAWDDYVDWQDADLTVVQKINALIRECRRTPFGGLGKPEALKGQWAGWWSRRITQEHRLVYRVTGKGEGQTLEIVRCREHY